MNACISYIKIDETMTACTDDECTQCGLVFPACMIGGTGACHDCVQPSGDDACQDAILLSDHAMDTHGCECGPCNECELIYCVDVLDGDGCCEACVQKAAAQEACEQACQDADSEVDDAQSAVDALNDEIASLQEQMKEAMHSLKAESRRLVKATAKQEKANIALEALAG